MVVQGPPDDLDTYIDVQAGARENDSDLLGRVGFWGELSNENEKEKCDEKGVFWEIAQEQESFCAYCESQKAVKLRLADIMDRD